MLLRIAASLAVLLPCSAQGQQPMPEPATSPQPGRWPTAYPSGAETQLGNRVVTILSEPAVSRAHWGIAVTALDGSPIYGLDEGKLFRPASTAKLFTTAAAMALLGPDHIFTTQVYGKWNRDTGSIEGDLELVGAGDPSLGTNDLPYHPGAASDTTSDKSLTDLVSMVDQLQSKGIRHISGKVVVSDLLFKNTTAPPGWADEDLIWGYGALPRAFSISNDEVTMRIRPAKSADDTQAILEIKQAVPYLTVLNNIEMTPAGVVAPYGYGVDIAKQNPESTVFDVTGKLLPGSAPISEEVALPDPAMYAAKLMRSLLQAQGIQVAGEASVLHSIASFQPPTLPRLKDPHSCEASFANGQGCTLACLSSNPVGTVLASHQSPALATEVTYTLKTSANLHAEVLLEDLSPSTACRDGSTLSGTQVVWAWLHRISLDEHDYVFFDGSGLSTKDLVTPRAEAQLLAYAATQPWFRQWKAALPVGGVDGTLASRFTQPPLKGHVFAKTGTLGESRALAGFVQCRSGREVIFAILDDNHEPGTSADRVAMDKVVEAIAELN